MTLREEIYTGTTYEASTGGVKCRDEDVKVSALDERIERLKDRCHTKDLSDALAIIEELKAELKEREEVHRERVEEHHNDIELIIELKRERDEARQYLEAALEDVEYYRGDAGGDGG